MLAKVMSGGVVGVDSFPIQVEVDLSNGLPAFDIVGLPETSVRESRVRVRSALRNSGLTAPKRRTTVNLAPADVPKTGSCYDLPMAVGIIAAREESVKESAQAALFLGELSLDGRLRPVRGVLPVALLARDSGVGKIYVPPENASEAASVEGVTVWAPRTLGEAIGHLRGEVVLDEYVPRSGKEFEPLDDERIDMSDVRSQEEAKRAVLIAAAGAHNMLMVGPPGAGKTMLARRVPGILPAMTSREALETSRIYSVCGLLSEGLIQKRPFRSPHHTASVAAIVGGGAPPQPGEVSLAHNGVLFLDELPEFNRVALESLRQPLEERVVVIARVRARVAFPANAMLVASMNPCPCGHFGQGGRDCSCSVDTVHRYRARLSGPLLDRVDLHVEVGAACYDDLTGPAGGETTEALRDRVSEARERQCYRSGGKPVWNALLAGKELADQCVLDNKSEEILRRFVDVHGMSARAYARVLRVARTIADLEGDDRIHSLHLAEAIGHRVCDSRSGTHGGV